ncbi:MAG: hypothetical protein COB78_10715 [Hyphomicrobiales bacterium]|nr:MAG: hypothetical protein COB78_10715 [Hyphomicrobiales bacterium]
MPSPTIVSAAIERETKPKVQEPDYSDFYDDDYEDDCWQCGGEGFVSDCHQEFACVDPESGCDLCTRKCDVCS